jgi:hypothetical protein
MVNKPYIVCELTLAYASDIAKKALAPDEPVDRDDIICPMGKYAGGRNHEVYKRFVRAQQKIGRL